MRASPPADAVRPADAGDLAFECGGLIVHEGQLYRRVPHAEAQALLARLAELVKAAESGSGSCD